MTRKKTESGLHFSSHFLWRCRQVRLGSGHDQLVDCSQDHTSRRVTTEKSALTILSWSSVHGSGTCGSSVSEWPRRSAQTLQGPWPAR